MDDIEKWSSVNLWIYYVVLRVLLLLPIILFGLLGYYKIFEGLIAIILIIVCYIFLIPISIVAEHTKWA